MERKMIPLAVPNLSGNEKKYLNECINTTFVSSVGEFVTRIEKMTAEITGCKYAAATSAGTTALHMALVASGVERDDIVIIPTFTFIATANAVAHCGAIPWCMDIESTSWTLDSNQLKEELAAKTEMRNGQCFHIDTGRRVVAIIPVYTLGNVPDMDAIMDIAKIYHLKVIGDAAAAIGATYKGRKVGELADLTAISFNGNKTITAGGGGMVVSNDEKTIELIHHISSTARVGTEYEHDMVGYNYRMTNLQAAVGCAQLEQADQFVKRKKEIRRFYAKAFENIKGIHMFPEPMWGESACWLSGIFFDSERHVNIRDLCKKLKEEGIEARSFWKPVHMQKPYVDCLKSEVINTEEIWNQIVMLPCSTGIGTKELSYVCGKIIKIWNIQYE